MKQRLVGAIVLVALAVIFLPMLLDGSGNSGPRQIAIEIPAEPQPPSNRLEEWADPAGTEPQAPASTGADVTAAAPESAPAGDSEPLEAPPETHADTAEEAADAPAISADAAANEGSAAGPAAGSDSGPSAGPTAWAVQVGSFTRETNALVLRDRLRAAGFDAFTERASSDEGSVWRVRIGPVATEQEADQLSARVTAERDIPTLVVSHP